MVRDLATGLPIADASVEIFQERNDNPRLVAVIAAGANGSFTFSGATPGMYHLVVRAEGRGTQARTVNVPSAGVQNIALDLSAPATLRGVIRSATTSLPLADARVVLRNDNATLGELSLTDAAGNYQFEDLAPGDYTLIVQAAGHETVVLPLLAVLAGGELRDVALNVGEIEVSGVVRNAAGAVSGALVLARDANDIVVAEAVTGADGTYSLTTLPPGSYRIRAIAETHLPSNAVPVMVSQGETVANINLDLIAAALAESPNREAPPAMLQGLPEHAAGSLAAPSMAEAETDTGSPAWLTQFANQVAQATFAHARVTRNLDQTINDADESCRAKYETSVRNAASSAGRNLFNLTNSYQILRKAVGDDFLELVKNLKLAPTNLTLLPLEEIVGLVDQYDVAVVNSFEYPRFRTLFPNVEFSDRRDRKQVQEAISNAMEAIRDDFMSLIDQIRSAQSLSATIAETQARLAFFDQLFERWRVQLSKFRSPHLSESESDFQRVEDLIFSGGTAHSAVIAVSNALNDPLLVKVNGAIQDYRAAHDEFTHAISNATTEINALKSCNPEPTATPSPTPTPACTPASQQRGAQGKSPEGETTADLSGPVTLFTLTSRCEQQENQTPGPAIRTSFDPNDKIGPAGFGAEGFVQPGVMPFTILFENDPALGATIPAQEVFVTDVLDEDLDLATLEFTGFGFNNFEFDVPPGLSHYETTIDLRPEGIELLVPVKLEVNTEIRELMATFRSLDPLTGLLPDALDAGFLPVNDKNLHNGEGFFSYRVRPKAGLPSGTEVLNQGSIVFDVNEPILTPQTRHTLDHLAPSSQVMALPATTGENFRVSWSGQDDAGGSGIAYYDVYVSVDGGAFAPWLTETTQTSANYPGEVDRSYRFYAIARDQVGWTEAPPAAGFDAETTVTSFTWTNANDPLDVVLDGRRDLVDLLALVRHLRNWGSPHTLPAGPTAELTAPPFVDVSGGPERVVEIFDLLLLVRALREQNMGLMAGEVERIEVAVALARPSGAHTATAAHDAVFASNAASSPKTCGHCSAFSLWDAEDEATDALSALPGE